VQFDRHNFFPPDLFQQYISQSGAAIANWGIDPDPVRAATEIGINAGCTDTEINALTQCLMSVDAVTLNLAYATYQVCSLNLSSHPTFTQNKSEGQ
jgi:hypothetical protein